MFMLAVSVLIFIFILWTISLFAFDMALPIQFGGKHIYISFKRFKTLHKMNPDRWCFKGFYNYVCYYYPDNYEYVDIYFRTIIDAIQYKIFITNIARHQMNEAIKNTKIKLLESWQTDINNFNKELTKELEKSRAKI